MLECLRIALITDIHFGPNELTKRGSLGLKLLEEVLDTIAAWQPDLLIDLGDRINDSGGPEDIARLEQVSQLFRQLTLPRVHLLGNHDVAHLSVEQSETTLQSPLQNRSITINGWHLTFWYPAVRYQPKLGNLKLTDDDLTWLSNDLDQATYPCIVFSHVPVSDGSMIGNIYFETRPHSRAGYANAALARTLMEQSGKVIAAVAGHVHWNSLNTIDGIHHLTLQSLTETFTTSPYPTGTWGKLELDTRLSFSAEGRDWLQLHLPIRTADHHWRTYGSRGRIVNRPAAVAQHG